MSSRILAGALIHFQSPWGGGLLFEGRRLFEGGAYYCDTIVLLQSVDDVALKGTIQYLHNAQMVGVTNFRG